MPCASIVPPRHCDIRTTQFITITILEGLLKMKQAENEVKYAIARAFLAKLLGQGRISQDEFNAAERHAAKRLNAKLVVLYSC